MVNTESVITGRLKSILGKKAEVSSGLRKQKSTAWVNPEVFIHFSAFEDFGGITQEGAHIGRRLLNSPPGFKGFAEERPGRVTLEIECLAINYALVQEISTLIIPESLIILESTAELYLSDLKSKVNRFVFCEFQSHLHSLSYKSIGQDETVYFCGNLVFYLDGFLHVNLAKRGGFKPAAKTNSAKKM